MKVIYAHDHKFYSYNDKYYSVGNFSEKILKRYIKSFGEINFVCRIQKCEKNNIKNLSNASISGVNYCPIIDIRNPKNLFRYRSVYKEIEKLISDADIVIARLPSTNGILCGYLAKKYNKKIIIEVVGCAWDANISHGSPLGKLIAPIEFLLMKKIVANADAVIYITKKYLQEKYPNYKGKTEVCPNVLITSLCEEVLDSRRQKIKSKKETLRLGLVGSLDVDYKGHESLIRCIELLEKNNFFIEVDFLGNGNPKRWIKLIEELQIKSKINFLGTLAQGDAVNKWLDTLDIQVQPSLVEAQGRSIIEGMARACPIVATKTGGIVELIDDSWLVEVGDIKALARKIQDLGSSKDMMLKVAERNFYEAKGYLESDINLRRDKLFNEMISGI